MTKKQKVRSRVKLFVSLILITMLTLTGFSYFNRSAEADAVGAEADAVGVEANAVGLEDTQYDLALLDSSLADMDDAIEFVNSGIAIGNTDIMEQGIFQVYRVSREARGYIGSAGDQLPKGAQDQAEDLYNTLMQADDLQQDMQTYLESPSVRGREDLIEAFLEFSEQYDMDMVSLLLEMEPSEEIIYVLGAE